MSQRIVCLGNPKPKAYLNNPMPQPSATLADIRAFADLLHVDLTECLQLGQDVKDNHGNVVYTATEDHVRASMLERIGKPVEVPYSGPKARTKIKFSEDSTLLQCVAEARTIWRDHGNGTPTWISGTNESLIAVLADELGIPEIRPYEDDGL